MSLLLYKIPFSRHLVSKHIMVLNCHCCLVWPCMALCRLVSPCVALCRLVSPRMDLLLFNAIVMCGLIRLNMALSNLVWSCMAWPCMAWPCMAFLRTLVLLSLVQITQPYMRLSQCMTMHWQQFLSCISFIGFCLAKQQFHAL